MKSLNAGQEVIHEGDVVSIHDSTLKKGFWRRGLVKSLIRGRDQEVRGAEVKISSKGQKPRIINQASTPAIVSLGITLRSTDG